jgi:ribose/xylose/arabinose/galactoside ABC-type transport system permease subunit
VQVSTNSDAGALSPEPGPRFSLAKLSGILAPLSFLLILSILLSIFVPHFRDRDNLKNIAIQAAVVAILACGQTAVIISGNIDLSVGAVMAFAGVVAAQAMNHNMVGVWGGVGIAIAAGLAMGAISGLITAYGKIPSFIVTLGMMGVVYGSAGIVANSRNVSGLSPGFEVFGTGELFGGLNSDGIPYAVLIMLAVAVIVHIFLSKTAWGRSIYAIGGNREAARLSGINLTKSVTTVFALSGLLAGIAAVVNISRTNIAPLDAGNGYELYAVAATVIGGTSLFGGQGGILGTIIGALLMYTIRNWCALKSYPPEYERVIVGVVVILAVLYDRFGPGRKNAAHG